MVALMPMPAISSAVQPLTPITIIRNLFLSRKILRMDTL